MKNNILRNVGKLFVIVTIAIIFSMNSDLCPLTISLAGTDSSVFKTVSMMMRKGYMPYRDSFDHKGPLLYIINYWGDKISLYRGVWVFAALLITIFFMYKIARLLCSEINSFCVIITATTPLFGYYEGGNFTEEYAMPFIALSLYYFLKYYLSNDIKASNIFICGISCGGGLLLRPNMITVWIVFCIAIVINNIGRKQWKHHLGRFTIWFTFGLCSIVLPICIWLSLNGVLDDCWHDYIIFNNMYSLDPERATLYSRLHSYFHFCMTPLWFVSVVLCIFSILYREKKINFSYLVYLIISPLFICLSGMEYDHYGMVLVPAFSYPLALIFNEISNIEKESASKILGCIVGIWMVVTFAFGEWSGLVISVQSKYHEINIDSRNNNVIQICQYIENNTSKEDCISVYGNMNIIYVLSNRRHATKYSYQFPIGQIDTNIMDEYYKELQNELPPVVVVENSYYDERINEFLEFNDYKLTMCENEDNRYEALVFCR